MEIESSMQLDSDYASLVSSIEKIDPLDYARTRNFADGAVTVSALYFSRGSIHTQVFSLNTGT